MSSVKLRREAFQSTLDRVSLTKEENELVRKLIGDGARSVNIDLRVDALPKNYLAGLLDEPSLNVNQRAMISMRVHGIRGSREDYERIYQTIVSTRLEFASTFSALGVRTPNCEYFLNGRWYPINLGANTHEDENRMFSTVRLQGTISVGDTSESVSRLVGEHLFRGPNGEPKERTIGEVLQDLGLRQFNASPTEFNLRLLNSERRSRETGRQIWITGPGLISNEYSWWSRLESRSIGTPHSPRRAIIDHELETNQESRGYYGVDHTEHASRLPFVRAFCFDTKRYVYVDVDDIRDYEFDETAITRLHLPSEMLDILSTVFRAPTEAIFGDLIAGKHGGIVILAAGNPGVGKTLTAEVYSELTQRPLYVLELGELGTNAVQVEENLNRVFTRVVRWNAVLQFDECEIFLAKRGTDLERSAIVGIFLRLLDYYRGILFLTTNRADVLDPAVLSRVTLRLSYPDLTNQTRLSIWRTMLSVANLQTDDQMSDLTSLPLNGRQIRNIVRLARIVHAGKSVTAGELMRLVQIAVPDLITTTI
jgi:hypothetical protein